jgi:hypothetical protein
MNAYNTHRALDLAAPQFINPGAASMNTNAVDACRHHETWLHVLGAGSKLNLDKAEND